jgi:hypothetical protein
MLGELSFTIGYTTNIWGKAGPGSGPAISRGDAGLSRREPCPVFLLVRVGGSEGFGW